MRPILFRLMLDRPWELWAADVQGVPGIGIAVVVLVFGLAVFGWVTWRRRGQTWTADDKVNVAAWLGLLVLLTFFAPALPQRLANWLPPEPAPPGVAPAPREPISSFPLFGYGTLVLTGFLAGTWIGQQRAKRAGLDPLFVFDVTFWTLIFGVAGGRLLYILQHGDVVFAGVQGLGPKLFAAINLSRGGLVLIGAMLGGAVGYFWLCRRRGVAPLPLLDLLTPSIFVGEGFGRLGCLLYGCCFGDPTTLPWGVQFGPGSAAYDTLVGRGFVLPSEAVCLPLHPTQVYMSINAFLLAFVTWAYYRHRRCTGEVFALGMILYALTRFLIEFVRADELGQLGTGLTISQLLSLCLAAVGTWLVYWLRSRSARAPNADV